MNIDVVVVMVTLKNLGSLCGSFSRQRLDLECSCDRDLCRDLDLSVSTHRSRINISV